MKRFGAFPSDSLIPESVRPVADRYVELSSNADEARVNIASLRDAIRQGEQADIAEAAEAIAAGSDTKPGTSNRDAAIKAVADAERHSQALSQALPKVAAELKAAYVATSDETYALADTEFDRASGAYIAAIEQLIEARKDWNHAIAARRFAEDATTGQREASYAVPNIDDSAYDVFRKEAATPSGILFAPKRQYSGSVHQAHIVQLWFSRFKIPSYNEGNTLTVVEHPDFGKAIEFMGSRSSWYLDGDCVRTDEPPQCVTINKVQQITPGMYSQCHWLTK